MRICAVFKNGVFWVGTLLAVTGAWTFGENIRLGQNSTFPGSVVLPLGVIFIIASLIMTCSKRGVTVEEKSVSQNQDS